MTFKEAIEAHQKDLRRQWAARKDDLLDALDNLKRAIANMERQANEPSPEGLHEVRLAGGTDLRYQSEKALRAYESLEGIKFHSRFVEQLDKKVTS